MLLILAKYTRFNVLIVRCCLIIDTEIDPMPYFTFEIVTTNCNFKLITKFTFDSKKSKICFRGKEIILGMAQKSQ